MRGLSKFFRIEAARPVDAGDAGPYNQCEVGTTASQEERYRTIYVEYGEPAHLSANRSDTSISSYDRFGQVRSGARSILSRQSDRFRRRLCRASLRTTDPVRPAA